MLRNLFSAGVALACGVVLVVWAMTGPAPAAQPPAGAKSGQDLATELCSACHATGLKGASRNPAAPPLRTLGERYSEEALERAFEEGLIKSHPAMPPFRLSPEQTRAILGYIKTIQERRAT